MIDSGENNGMLLVYRIEDRRRWLVQTTHEGQAWSFNTGTFGAAWTFKDTSTKLALGIGLTFSA